MSTILEALVTVSGVTDTNQADNHSATARQLSWWRHYFVSHNPTRSLIQKPITHLATALARRGLVSEPSSTTLCLVLPQRASSSVTLTPSENDARGLLSFDINQLLSCFSDITTGFPAISCTVCAVNRVGSVSQWVYYSTWQIYSAPANRSHCSGNYGPVRPSSALCSSTWSQEYDRIKMHAWRLLTFGTYATLIATWDQHCMGELSRTTTSLRAGVQTLAASRRTAFIRQRYAHRRLSRAIPPAMARHAGNHSQVRQRNARPSEATSAHAPAPRGEATTHPVLQRARQKVGERQVGTQDARTAVHPSLIASNSTSPWLVGALLAELELEMSSTDRQTYQPCSAAILNFCLIPLA